MLAAAAGECPVPTDVAVTGWANDPLTSGAYTHVPPVGAEPAYADVLGRPAVELEGLAADGDAA